MNLLFLSWRDIRSPKSGGAEVHTHGLMQCFLKNGCDVIHFSPLYYGLKAEETIDDIRYIRKGNIATVIFWAWRYYRKHRKTIDYVVDQCNTHRFFTGFWVPQKKRIFYIHQLTREIWDINLPFPLSFIGKHLETAMLRLQRHDITITVSQSTKEDLVEVGFDPDNITIVPNTISDDIVDLGLPSRFDKKKDFIYVGRYSRYKGIGDAIEAFGILKKEYKDCKLYIVGKKDEKILEEEIFPICDKYGLRCGDEEDNDVVLTGFVDEEEKYRLMAKSRVLLFPSQREGWGIIVTEAAALGTPSIVYDSPGCRDAVNYGEAGYLCSENTVYGLVNCMRRCIENEKEYVAQRKAAYDFAQQFSRTSDISLVGRFIVDMI